jgi:hypothetical protein
MGPDEAAMALDVIAKTALMMRTKDAELQRRWIVQWESIRGSFRDKGELC